MQGTVVRATQAQGTATHDRHKSAEKWDVWSLSDGGTEIQLWLFSVTDITNGKNLTDFIFLFLFFKHEEWNWDNTLYPTEEH